MMEWNNDEISTLIDFIEKRYLRMLSAIFLVQGTVMNLRQIFVQVSGNSFCLPVYGACVTGFKTYAK